MSCRYVTNLVSAFWHGFYPGYYIAFAKASFEIDIFRQLRGKFRPMFTKTVANKEGK
ncbi:MBOAT family O-acyltransferase, partial [Salmonella sp. SAL4359]|uniref:MBOAT family O-acyltransferase n=1 Tax=Salmonella sp. SAL4359 TaxID=3159880 RepID=UPI00397DBC9B